VREWTHAIDERQMVLGFGYRCDTTTARHAHHPRHLYTIPYVHIYHITIMMMFLIRDDAMTTTCYHYFYVL